MFYSEEKFNLTVEFCANIENNTEDPAYGPVEKEVVAKLHINECDKKTNTVFSFL